MPFAPVRNSVSSVVKSYLYLRPSDYQRKGIPPFYAASRFPLQ